jgi:hypothetical protein
MEIMLWGVTPWCKMLYLQGFDAFQKYASNLFRTAIISFLTFSMLLLLILLIILGIRIKFSSNLGGSPCNTRCWRSLSKGECYNFEPIAKFVVARRFKSPREHLYFEEEEAQHKQKKQQQKHNRGTRRRSSKSRSTTEAKAEGEEEEEVEDKLDSSST